MPFSSGTFSLNSTYNPVVTGTTISIAWANNTLNDIATGLTTCVLKDGSQTITANIPMAGFKFTGLAAGTASGNSLRYEQVNGVVTTAGDLLYASAAGTLARLAIGTANQVLSVNSGATAPEWTGARSTFTATLTGCTTSPTVTASYSVTNNVVTVFYPPVTATSNATTYTMTGAPNAIKPTTTHSGFVVIIADNGVSAFGMAQVGTDGVVSLAPSADGSLSAWTASGTKGSAVGFTLTYNLT